ncbi:MAG: DNA-binding protein [Candidatus Wolframiiraptor sp.]|nr:MAG: DNA-binding protein [Candidatus Wolframiiraptor sp.]
MVERSRDWIRQARRDLEAAEHQLAGGFYEWACFLAQQAAEKAVKAVFQKLGAEVFGHSVAGLLSSLPEGFKPGERLIDLAKELDKAYIPTRYPNAHPEGAPFELYTRSEAERLMSHAREVIEFCENLLSKIQER